MVCNMFRNAKFEVVTAVLVDSRFIGSYTKSTGKWSPTCQRTVMDSSSV